MNPEDQVARQAFIARLTGSPMPMASQVAPQAGMPAMAPQVPNPSPASGDRQLGDLTRKPSESDRLAKGILPGTAHQDPAVQSMSKALLQRLIPYLGK